MKLVQIEASYGRTVNMGDYNSMRVDIKLVADIEEGDDEAAAADALRAMARNQVMLELARTNGKLAAQVEGVFAGLPASVTKEIE